MMLWRKRKRKTNDGESRIVKDGKMMKERDDE